MLIIKYGTRDHCGSLIESLNTKQYITEKTFKELLKNYEFYGIDYRINQILFISKPISVKQPV